MTNYQAHHKYHVGELRPSQILFSYGIGAIIDLPNLATLVMGLEEWPENNSLELSEERLLIAIQAELGKQVKKLCTPPINLDNNDNNYNGQPKTIGIPVAPFPTWMVCPKCRLLAPLESELFELKSNPFRQNETRYVHKNCNKTKNQPPNVIPVRFLVACEHGHLDDFPWHYFVHQGNSDCHGALRLYEMGVSGAATDIIVQCDRCGSSRRLSDAFGESGKQNLPKCRGRHPHLRSFADDCDRQMKSMLLGASNSWFSITLSALSLPSNDTGKLEQLVNQYWTDFKELETTQELQSILKYAQKKGDLQEFINYSLEDLWSVITQKKQGIEPKNPRDLKTPEWEVFSTANTHLNNQEFSLLPVQPPQGFEKYFTKTVLIEKIREVRALIGFTRIQSPGDFGDEGEIPSEYRVKISSKAPTWIPSVEVKGEGIFLQFNETLLQEWEQLAAVKQRENFARNAHKDWLNSRGIDPDKIKFPGMRYLLIHSFSHALMRQLILECGYTSASIRERIYSQISTEENGPQAGLLIYTSAADSEGTLGGLVKLGKTDILGYHIAQTLEQMKICTSDPLCAEHEPKQGNISLHWAACHACLFSPETSCERGNKFLDRALLIPTLNTTNLAFFNHD